MRPVPRYAAEPACEQIAKRLPKTAIALTAARYVQADLRMRYSRGVSQNADKPVEQYAGASRGLRPIIHSNGCDRQRNKETDDRLAMPLAGRRITAASGNGGRRTVWPRHRNAVSEGEVQSSIVA